MKAGKFLEIYVHINLGGDLVENFAIGYYRICIWVTRFVYLNLLWLLFIIVGLVVFGAIPATTSMFAVVRKWVMGETEIPIFKTFWQSYRKEFIKANILGYLLILIGYILYIDLQYVRFEEGIFFRIIGLIILSMFFLYFIVLLYVFPLFVHFETKTMQYLKWALIIGVTHPVLTVLMAVGLAVVYFLVSSAIPGLLMFLLGSGSAFVLMWGASRTFSAFANNGKSE